MMGFYNTKIGDMDDEDKQSRKFDSMAQLGAQMGAISAQLSSWSPMNQIQNSSSDCMQGDAIMCGFKTFETDEDPREFLAQILKK